VPPQRAQGVYLCRCRRSEATHEGVGSLVDPAPRDALVWLDLENHDIVVADRIECAADQTGAESLFLIA
jgi:hypothetical protein